MTVITWASLVAQEQADYTIGLFFAFHPTRERTAESAMIDIGIADGESARKTGMKIDKREIAVRDAPLIWRTWLNCAARAAAYCLFCAGILR